MGVEEMHPEAELRRQEAGKVKEVAEARQLRLQAYSRLSTKACQRKVYNYSLYLMCRHVSKQNKRMTQRVHVCSFLIFEV